MLGNAVFEGSIAHVSARSESSQIECGARGNSNVVENDGGAGSFGLAGGCGARRSVECTSCSRKSRCQNLALFKQDLNISEELIFWLLEVVGISAE